MRNLNVCVGCKKSSCENCEEQVLLSGKGGYALILNREDVPLFDVASEEEIKEVLSFYKGEGCWVQYYDGTSNPLAFSHDSYMCPRL